MARKVQKNLIQKDLHTYTALSDFTEDDAEPDSQEALEYLMNALSPPSKK